jgi:hypothetical protein
MYQINRIGKEGFGSLNFEKKSLPEKNLELRESTVVF